MGGNGCTKERSVSMRNYARILSIFATLGDLMPEGGASRLESGSNIHRARIQALVISLGALDIYSIFPTPFATSEMHPRNRYL